MEVFGFFFVGVRVFPLFALLLGRVLTHLNRFVIFFRLSFLGVTSRCLLNFLKSSLLFLKSIIDHLLFVDLFEGAAILESQIAEHLEHTRTNILQIHVTLALSKLLEERVFILKHFVHIVTVVFDSATLVFSNLCVDFCEVLADKLIQVSQVLKLVEFVLRFFEVFHEVDTVTFALHAKFMLTFFDA